MTESNLIVTLTSSLAAAAILGYCTQRLRLSPILGYLLAGIVIGPHTPGFVADPALAEQLAEIGVILLLFGVGLQFRVEELLAVWRVAVPGAVLQSVTATVLTMVLLHAFGWPFGTSAVLGLAISVASTVVLVRLLSDNMVLHTPAGHIAVGWLLVEDLFTVFVIVALPALSSAGASSGQAAVALLTAAAKVAVLVVVARLVGYRLVPMLLEHVASTRSRELFRLTVLAVALGIAVGSAHLFGVSMALGAFVAGIVVGRTEFSLRAAAEALPIRDAFAVLFFVSIGMLLQPLEVAQHPALLCAVLVVIFVAKPLAAFVLVLLFRYPFRTAMIVAVALTQIGEFSFILATLARRLQIMDDAAVQALIAGSIISITANPFLYKTILPLERWLSSKLWLWAYLQRQAVGESESSEEVDGGNYRAVIVGHGPVGQSIARLLRENEIQSTIIELNVDSVRQLKAQGINAIYGDASHEETLKAAGVPNAATLILSPGRMAGLEQITRLARQLNPDVRILARTEYAAQMPVVERAGATQVFADELEMALAFTETILRALGATGEQVEQERARVHRELGANGTVP